MWKTLGHGGDIPTWLQFKMIEMLKEREMWFYCCTWAFDDNCLAMDGLTKKGENVSYEPLWRINCGYGPC